VSAPFVAHMGFIVLSCIHIHYTVILHGSHEKRSAEHFVFCVLYLYMIKYGKIA
jgi:hypothetical protein